MTADITEAMEALNKKEEEMDNKIGELYANGTI